MKPRTVLPLLLLGLLLFMPRHALRAQNAQDSIYITVDPNTTVAPTDAGWHFSFNHSGPSLTPVTTITLVIDTVQYPNVRFNSSATTLEDPAFSQFQWTTFGSPSGSLYNDSIWWCSSPYSIPHTQKDSFFAFALSPYPNANAPFYDSTVVIHWYASSETNGCKNFSPISSGSFVVTPTIFQGNYPLDTVTGSATVLPDCDPSFNFTVQNRNPYQVPIDHMMFSLMDPYEGTMRPSEAIPPPGWVLDSVTNLSAIFETNSNAIQPGASLGGFKVGMRAPDNTTLSVPFVWSAYSGSGLIDRDTIPPISVKTCGSSANSSEDTLRIANNLQCAFRFNLENSHSGELNLTVSPINKFVMHITTPGVTWSEATAPSTCWGYPGLNSQTLLFLTPTPSCVQPSGLTWTYYASINDTNPGELVTIQWSDSLGSTGISSGTDTFRCVPPPTPDSIFVDALGSCGYRVRVKNAHVLASGVHAVLLEMPTTAGTFAPPFSSNHNWNSNLGTKGTSLLFTTPSADLQTGETDTFYFNTNPANPGTPWDLTASTLADNDNTISSKVFNNVPGCTPPVVMDSITHHINTDDCSDTIHIVNFGTDAIDSIEIMPAAGVTVTAKVAIPWTTTSVGNNLIISGGDILPQSPLTFYAYYSGETPSTPFDVKVITIHTAGPATTSKSQLTCASSGVTQPEVQAPLSLSIAPNPLRGQTSITLTTTALDRVRVILLNVLGVTDETVVDRVLGPGEHTYTLDASTLAAGTYYLRVQANTQVTTKKLVIER